MSFIKTGDACEITSILDENDIATCDKCKEEVNTIKISNEKNEISCDCEDEDENEQN